MRRLLLEPLESRCLLAGLPIDTLDRDAVVAAYADQYRPYIDVPVEWSGSVQGCVAGTVSPRSTDATLNVLNFLRNMAGLEGVELDDGFNQKAQQAALMMDAQGALSHGPGPDWACYTQAGAQGAGASNLYLGVTGPKAMVGYVEDPGGGNYAVGHRRWLLNPHVDTMGVGSTTRANALYIFGPRVDPPAPDWIAWPPPGYVPKELVFPRWSLSRDGADFSQATVQMVLHGQPVPVDIQPIVANFALNTLVWEPIVTLDPISAEEAPVDVVVDNVRVDGQVTSFRYTVVPMQPGPPIETVAAARDDQFSVAAGQSSFYFDVLANDDLTQSGWAPATTATLAAEIVGGPSHGRVAHAIGSPGILFYFPDSGFTGVDTFSYRVADLDSGRVSNLAHVQITVGAAPANRPPTISNIANATITMGGATSPISFTVGDAETSASNLIVTASSANQTLVPNQNIAIGGNGAQRTVTITGAAGQLGSDTITLWVSDGQNTTLRSFVITVVAPPPPPPPPLWRNPVLREDTNNDGFVSPIDALLIINLINRRAADPLGADPTLPPRELTPDAPYYDTNGDGLLSPSDVLLVINFLNVQAAASLEGEHAPAPPEREVSTRGDAEYAVVIDRIWDEDDDDDDDEEDDDDLLEMSPGIE